MILALVRKELREHGRTFFLVALLGIAIFGFADLQAARESDAAGVFEALRLFTLFFTLPAALVLGNRLVVQEYEGRTQLFLETLPIPRWLVIGVKYGLGLGLLLACFGAVFAACAWRAPWGDAPTGRSLAIMASRGAAWCFALWALAFAFGFLGRYRWPTYVGVAAGVLMLDTQLAWDWNRAGPLSLLDATFATEREVVPWRDLQATVALGVALSLGGFGLGLLREGSIAARLAQVMSMRERAAIAALFCGFAFGAALAERSRDPLPYDLPGALAVTAEGVVVKVSSAGSGPETRDAARQIADDVAALRRWLGLEQPVQVFLAVRRNLDPDLYERAQSEGARGVVVRANLAAPDFDRERFTAWLLRELIAEHSRGRALTEPRAWVLAGVGPYAMRPEMAQQPLAAQPTLALRALYGAPEGVDAAWLDRWFAYRDTVGDDIAEAVAWSGLRALGRAKGDDATRAFVRALFAQRPERDARALLHDWRHPPEALLREHAGISTAELLSAWNAELEEARQDLGAQVLGLPRLAGALTPQPVGPQARLLRYVFESTVPPDPAGGDRFEIRWAPLPGVAATAAPTEIRRERHRWETDRTGALGTTFERGDRLRYTFALHVEALDGAVISGWRTLVVP